MVTNKIHKELTVLCPGIILDTDANFKFLSPLLEIQIKEDSSYTNAIVNKNTWEISTSIGHRIHFLKLPNTVHNLWKVTREVSL